jgi:hypothetical protein
MVTVANFGDSAANGTYTLEATFNGYPFYRKNAYYYMAYHEQYGPYSFTPSYYIFKSTQLEGSIRINRPEYKVEGTDATASGWINMMSQSSGETDVGTVS